MRRLHVMVMSGGLIGLALVMAAVLLTPTSQPAHVQADQANDPVLLELVQRYLQTSSTSPVEFLPAAIPADLPMALPLPGGSRLIGSVTRRFSTRSTSWDVLFDAIGSPTEVVTFYEQALRQIGWTTPPPFTAYYSGYVPTGFQDHRTYTPPTRTPVPRTPTPTQNTTLRLCPSTGNAGMTVTTRAMQNGITGVDIQIDSAGGGCSSLRYLMTPTASPAAPAIPALTAPANVTVDTISYDDEPDTVTEATADTDMSPAELEAFYAKQLVAAGWTRITGDARGPLAWSVWNTPKGKQGYFSVLEIAGTQTRDLHLQIASIGDYGDDDERTLPTTNRAG